MIPRTLLYSSRSRPGTNSIANYSTLQIKPRYFSSCFKLPRSTSNFLSLNLFCASLPTNSRLKISTCNGRNRVLFHKPNLCFVDSPYLSQRRSFSLKDHFDTAIVTHTALFKSLSGSKVVEITQDFIIQFHDSSGLPWWLSIVLTTCLLRTVVTLPIALYQAYVVARLENIRLEMDSIVNDILYDLPREARRNRWTEKQTKRHFQIRVKQEWTRLILRDNCHPAKTVLLALIQIPMWVIMSTALRNLVYMLPHQDTLAQLKRAELSVGGVAWFPDLTASDIFIFPIALGLVNLAIVELQPMLHKGKRSKIQKYATNFFRGFSVFMIPVATLVPSCLTLYWLTSSSMGLCQNLFLLAPRVRRLVGIPSTPSSHQQPFAHLLDQIKNKFR